MILKIRQMQHTHKEGRKLYKQKYIKQFKLHEYLFVM